MYEKLFSNQKALSPKDLQQYAQELGLDMPKFQKCLDSGKYASKIRKDLDDAQKAGITGAPTFLLGLTVPNDPKVKILKTLVGAKSYADFKEAIDSLLSSLLPITVSPAFTLSPSLTIIFVSFGR